MARRAEIAREKGTNRAAFFRGEVDKYTWVAEGSSYVLSDLLAVVREAPSRWFALVPALLDKLDRVDLLVKTMQSAQLRSQILKDPPGATQVLRMWLRGV
mgnify:CR=1 FL=1